VGQIGPGQVLSLIVDHEMLFYFRVLNWCSAYVLNQILFRDIGDVLLITAYVEQVIKGLVLVGPDMFRN